MLGNPFELRVIWNIGPAIITQPVVTTWGIMAVLALLGALLSRRLTQNQPSRIQTLAELMMTTMRDEISATMRLDATPFLPLVATMFIFILAANLSGLLPGVTPPTSALETDLALALIVFFAVFGWGIKRHGFWGYVKTYAQPNLLVLPLNLLEAITRVISMTMRLFGNIMSGVFISAIVLALAGLLVPIPFMALELLTGAIQAYIFTVLSMVFIAAAATKGETLTK